MDKEFFDLLCYLLTSARGLVDEPKMYGPFRLVETASRLIFLLEKHGMADEFLTREREKIETGKDSVMESEEKFIEFLDELILEFTEELKRD